MIDLKEYDLIQIYLLYLTKLFQCDMSLDLFLGMFYLYCHQLYLLCIIAMICFTTNINHLFMILIILFINLISIIIFKTCPIYLMEQKYLNTSFFRSFMKMCGISFCSVKKNIKNKKHFTKHLEFCIDEFTFQFVFSFYLLIVLKIMMLIIL